MSQPPALMLDRERERAQQLVGDAYAREFLDHDEVDRRMEAIHAAESLEALQRVTQDLASFASPPALAVGPAEPAALVRPPLRLSATLSNLERVGPWTLGARQEVRVILGSVTLDLRNVIWSTDVAEIEVDVLFGSLELVVPPGLTVDIDCTSILATVESQDTIHAGSDASIGSRRVRLRGRVIFGSVSVREQFLGEGAVAAWWRRQRERRALGRGRLKSLPPERSDDG